MSKILVVEDDLTLSAGLCFALDEDGHLSVAAYTCQTGMALTFAENLNSPNQNFQSSS